MIKNIPGGVLPYMGYIGMCGPQRVWFFNRFGHKKGINFCTVVFNSVFLEETTRSPIRALPSSTPFDTVSNKSPSQIYVYGKCVLDLRVRS